MHVRADKSPRRVEGLFYHSDSLAHEAFMIRPLLRIHVVWRVDRFVVLAVLLIHSGMK
jgi:hypothetical protein